MSDLEKGSQKMRFRVLIDLKFYTGDGDYFLTLHCISPTLTLFHRFSLRETRAGAPTYLVPAGLVLQAEPQSWLLKWHKATSK